MPMKECKYRVWYDRSVAKLQPSHDQNVAELVGEIIDPDAIRYSLFIL